MPMCSLLHDITLPYGFSFCKCKCQSNYAFDSHDSAFVHLPPPCISRAIVQATIGVGTVMMVYII